MDIITINTVVADDVRLVRYYNNEMPLFPEPLLGVLRKNEFCWLPTNPIPLHECDDITERLRKAHISRKQPEPTEEQIQFWTKRKQMDMAVIKQLSIPCNTYDITKENWDEHINSMINNCIK